MTEQPPPGFYSDPADLTRERWWDGSAWGEHRRQAPGASSASPPPAAAPGPAETSNILIGFDSPKVANRMVDVGVWLAVLFPPMGLVIGAVVASSPGKLSSGLWLMVMALVFGGIWFLFLSNAFA